MKLKKKLKELVKERKSLKVLCHSQALPDILTVLGIQ